MNLPKSQSAKISALSIQQKYQLYEDAVQSPESDIEFFLKAFSDYKKKPLLMREDFAGTSLLSHEWIKSDPKRVSYAIDLDHEPFHYSRNVHLPKLSNAAKKRMHYINKNVLSKNLNIPLVDLVLAMNFSYFIFKERDLLLSYFKRVHGALNKSGIFFLDCFGGLQTQKKFKEKKHLPKYTYFWECKDFNPINQNCHYAIHFKMNQSKKGDHKKNNKTYRDVFTYDWRLWSLAEIQDLLKEANFSKTEVFWEGDNNRGGGDGIFTATKKSENCLSWVAYLAAYK